MITDLPAIPSKQRLSSYEILLGPAIPKINRLMQMSEDDFEVMCLEWATAYLPSRYTRVRQLGGAGDKGRDVIAETSEGKIDIYQCKHYATALAPTDIYAELGKLCFYTQRKEFAVPRHYYLVSPQRLGPTLHDMLANPDTINALLIENWEKYCQKKIQSTPVLLTGDLLKYVQEFNFGILRDKAPLELIEEHAQTVYHAARFGGGLKKVRSIIPTATTVVQDRELPYVTQLFDVYSQLHQRPIADRGELQAVNPAHAHHFDNQRNSFYAAESLEVFSRENFPDSQPMPFNELKDDAKVIADNTLLLHASESGYRRVLLVTAEVIHEPFASNPLNLEMKPIDKQGICHHLANEKSITWIP